MIERSWMRWPDSLSDNRKSKTCGEQRRTIQNRKLVRIVALLVTLALGGAVVEAQQTTKVPRIGFLGTSSASFLSARIETFRQGLRELGYIEGKNIAIEYRFADGKEDRLPELAAELVSLKVDIIVTTPASPAAKNVTKTIPIVFVGASDPVGIGLVDSLARPGGNLTGLTILNPELSGKRLELLKEASPRITRVAFPIQPVESNQSVDFGRNGKSSKGTRDTNSIPRSAQSQRFRWRIRRSKTGRRSCSYCSSNANHQYSSSTDLRICVKEPAAGDFREPGDGGSRRPHVLFAGFLRAVSPCRSICG
jgi:ABC transporter substrate binding protein